MTSSSSTDSSSGQHHPYAYTNMTTITTTNKITSPPTVTNLVVDSTSHLPEIINIPSSPSIIETTNSNIQQISTNELINNENVCLKKTKQRCIFF